MVASTEKASLANLKSAQAMTDNVNGVEDSEPPKPKTFWFWTFRAKVSLLLCYAVLVTGFFRVSINMAIVCMVNNTAVALLHDHSLRRHNLYGSPADGNNNISNLPLLIAQSSAVPNISLPVDEQRSILLERYHDTGNVSSSPQQCVLNAAQRAEYDGELLWTSTEDQWIRTAVFYGQIISNIPSGWLADRYGPKNILVFGSLLQMICSILTPTAARFSFIFAISLRFLTGIAQGAIFPAISSTIIRWFPPDELSTVTGIYTAGNQLCMIIGMPLFAWLCSQHQFLGGWPSIFYFSALFALPWCLIWSLLITNSPSESRRMPEKEKAYIEYSHREQSLRRRKGTKLPWRDILSSVPIWACNATFFGASFSVSILQAYLPRYYKDVLFLDIKQNGLFCALPFLCQWVVKCIVAYLSDVLGRRTNISRTVNCKIFNSVACFGLAIFLVALSYLDCHQATLAIVLLCVGQALSAGFIPGAGVCLYFLAPQYSGTLKSFVSFFMHISGIIGPYIVNPITEDGSREGWQTIFFLTAAILCLGGILFVLFGSAEIQDWAKDPQTALLSAEANETCDLTATALEASSGANGTEAVNGKV